MTTAKWMSAAMMALALAGCGGSAGDTSASEQAATSGMPNGAHFNLNIIGKDGAKSQVDCGNGHVIFVPLAGTSKILLTEGDFSVLDCNGTDGAASFQLPSPDPDGDGTTTYSVWARALGKPGGSASMTTCATDPTTGEQYCSLLSAVLVRNKGKSSFTNISKELLFVYADIDGDGITDRVPLFDSRLQDFFWNYQNNGLRLAQLRFYEVPTTVP
ncbi:MAG: hypothetical protein QM765_34175 [Myxococcales bacterium]